MQNEPKHTAEELKQMQSLPLDIKIKMSQRRIREWYEHWQGDVYVSISGGKDSQVLAHMVKQMYPDVPLVFVDTGLEYNSVRKKGRELADDVLTPEMSFVQVIKKYGYPIISKEVAQAVEEGKRYFKALEDGQGGQLPYAYRIADFMGIDRRIDKENELYKALKMGNIPSPKFRTCQLLGIQGNYNYGKMYDKSKYFFLLNAPFKISHKCCDVMKKKPTKIYAKQTNRQPFIGTLADESQLRRTSWLQNGCNAFNKKSPSSQPLSFWTENDILEYIFKNKIEIAEVYGQVVKEKCEGFEYQDLLIPMSENYSTTGVDRTGCTFCMFGINQDKDRFLKLKEIEPKKYDYIMRGGQFDENGLWIPYKGLGYKFVIDWLNENGNLNIKY